MLQLIYRDENICIVNKPSGYVVHKTRGAEKFPILLQTLRDQIDHPVYPVHRLDRGTSGCIAFALNSKTAKLLQVELQSPNSIKKYTALCRGHTEAAGEIHRPLSDEKKVKQAALTKYLQQEKFNDSSLLEVEIFTGRKHQIRRHFSFLGHQIIGDVTHGKGWLNRKFRENYNFHRLFLHCHYLFFLHPYSGERIHCHSPLPEELEALLTQLRETNKNTPQTE